MRYLTGIFIVLISVWHAPSARGDLFGGDIALLTQILSNSLNQLTQLKKILDTDRENLKLSEKLHQGIHDALDLSKSLGPTGRSHVYGDILNVESAMKLLKKRSGEVPQSEEAPLQRETDQSAAEAITLGNEMYAYAEGMDAMGEKIKAYAKGASPSGAQKTTTETLGVILHVLNESLRAQATELKLQAQALSLENKREKAKTASFLSTRKSLSEGLQERRLFFQYPRF